MNHDSTPPQVSLEQLLRLKRAERPAPEFWQQFEREMHLKQLAAIVEPRPWWAPFIRISSRIARYQLPVGATAILALTFITVREYRLPNADEGFSTSVIETKIDTMPGPAVTAVLPERVSAAVEAPGHAKTVAALAKADPGETTVVSGDNSTPRQVADLVPMLGDATVDAAPEYSPAARAIAANLAAVKASAPELVRLMERVPGMESIMNPPERTQVVDPLSRVQSPSDSRRTSRLLASALQTVSYPANEEGGDRVMVADRVSRSLTEDRLYGSISRFGVKADRVAIKF